METNTRRAFAVATSAMLALALAAPVAAQDDPDYLQRIMDAGTIRMSTDGLYPPQSELTPDGAYVGFDIDVGTEIAQRLGAEIEFIEPAWELVTAGSWGDRWDFSVGSMTITSPRQEVLDFTQPYYFTPAQLAAHADLGYTSTDDLAGKTICMGAATTYLDWMSGTLDFGTESPETAPPEGSVATTYPTDRDCAQIWGGGRMDFEGWLTSSVTVQDAIDDGLPVVALGEPVFYEPLAVAFDKGVEDNDSLVAAIDAIVGEMHEDGTLSELSVKWYGEDLTVRTDAMGGDEA
jgi:polar amino acid transport system substrate-binding protein